MGIFDKFKNNKILTSQERRLKSVELLRKQGIAINEHLPLLTSSENINLKSAEEVIKRALASILCIQLAYSIRNSENHKESALFVLQKLNEWNISIDDLLPKERLLLQNKYTKNDNEDEFTEQDLIDIVYTYEMYYSLIWSLDLISNKELLDVSRTCNTEKAMAISSIIIDLSPLKLKNTEKILDMIDLFYCYH
ncbi:MAG: DUF4272 domain-containing protein [Clostridia bacterium]|nr:DUF4272 domain-containing protein [Clostridia bacterium]